MPARLIVLASGSSGNANLLELDGFGLLIDCGLNPHELGNRLQVAGKSWNDVSAVLLTHTHGDHWNTLTLAQLRRLSVPLIAHPFHHSTLAGRRDYEPLRRAELTRSYEENLRFDVTSDVTCLPIRVPHDSFPTFAFRFETKHAETEPGWALGFASDLGRTSDYLLATFAGVDVLAIEYNHDVELQRNSRRPRMLIDRVLGDHGHLSNLQAAEATRRIATSSGPNGLQAVIQLHLSRECNRPELAQIAAKQALATVAPRTAIITATQSEVAPAVELIARRSTVRKPLVVSSYQPTLPGLGDAESA